jgi:DNA-binding Xre family transcriptional regulator
MTTCHSDVKKPPYGTSAFGGQTIGGVQGREAPCSINIPQVTKMTNAGICVIEAQKVRGIKNADLARSVDVKPQQIIRWRSQKNMKLHTMEILCKVFDMTLDEFCSLGK